MSKKGNNKTLAEGQCGSPYMRRQKIHPREVKGRFQYLRHAATVVLLGIYYLLPWIDWGSRQAVLFDLPARKFYIFGWVFWPQDFFYLTLLLVIAALSLFFFTALAGRLWCGYACPQTVWTNVFIWMERLTEGTAHQRHKLDKSPWTAKKLRRRTAKHTLWFAFAAWTGFTFVGYFTPIGELGTRLTAFQLGPWETFWVIFYAFATWGNAGFMREQVCIYMCPYARFQSAMFDRDTLIIAYDEKRGEPRGGRKRGEVSSVLQRQRDLTRPSATLSPGSLPAERETGASGVLPEALGDCIDCNLCVQACPTGIDIRNGLQYECIACAACVDVCDTVMDRMDYPRGLIRYTTQNAAEGKPTKVLRPRTLLYGTALVALTVALFTAIALRVPLAMDVLRDRNALYRELGGERIENVYTLKIMNRDQQDRAYALAADGLEGMELVMDADNIRVPAGEVLSLPVRIRAPRHAIRGASSKIEFTVSTKDAGTDDAGASITEEARFIGPVSRGVQ